MILQAWLTLPSCLASSSRPTLLRMTFWSFVIVGSPLAPPPGRGDIAPPRRLSAHRYHLIRQIKSRLLQLCRVLTDRGTEYCGRPEHHEYELYLAVEDIDHTRTKTKSPQTNGICERFPQD